MNREWTLSTGVDIHNTTMEGMLIETYGCMPLNDRVINLEAGRSRRRVRPDAMWIPALLDDASALSA